MANLSQQKRRRMLEFLQTIRKEHKDDDDVLIALGEIESELNAKKYGLVWEQHEEAVDAMMRDNIPVFTEVPEREIAAAPGEGYNFILEGDNLHSLRLLEKTHKGKIDVIYIDPPYNTGNKDFVYDDAYIDAEDGFRHSKWASFMSERLQYAKHLLHDKGFIAISIDDNEYAVLKLLCDEIIGHALHGQYIRTDMVMESRDYLTTHKRVNTHKHGMELLHCVDSIKSTIGMPANKVKTILERLFRKGGSDRKKLLLLDTAEFYAFVINNERLLKEEFRQVTSDMTQQMSMLLHPKKSMFRIPEQDFFRYDPGVKNEVEYLANAYHEYTSGYATSLVRSTSEMLFEQYCESRDDVEWVYKNGDSGQQYFSIVYIDGLRHQWLFYADYIVMMKNGTVWVIETKGGEVKGKDKNIDRQIQNKFNAFKAYAAEKGLHWGFVRDKDNQLYINNTEFSIDMADEHWVPIAQEI